MALIVPLVCVFWSAWRLFYFRERIQPSCEQRLLSAGYALAFPANAALFGAVELVGGGCAWAIAGAQLLANVALAGFDWRKVQDLADVERQQNR